MMKRERGRVAKSPPWFHIVGETRMVRFHMHAVAIGFLLLAWAPATLAQSFPIASAADLAADARIHRALAQQLEAEFDGSLTVVVDYLRSRGVAVAIDTRALEEYGLGSDTPCHFGPSGIQLRSALRRTLRELELTWMIRDEVLVITTEEEAEMRLQARVYDVSDLLGPSRDFHSLTSVIMSTISPESWDHVGGPGAVEPLVVGSHSLLVVSQTDETHQVIAVLLQNLQRFAPDTPIARPAMRPPTIRRSHIPTTRVTRPAEAPSISAPRARQGGLF
jgi:hypothetical protein